MVLMLAVEKRYLEFGHLDDNISASSDDISIVMTILVLLIALILSSLNQFPRFHFQQLVEGFFYAALYTFFNLALDYHLIQFYNFIGHGLLSLFECLVSNFILPENFKPCLASSFCNSSFVTVKSPNA